MQRSDITGWAGFTLFAAASFALTGYWISLFFHTNDATLSSLELIDPTKGALLACDAVDKDSDYNEWLKLTQVLLSFKEVCGINESSEALQESLQATCQNFKAKIPCNLFHGGANRGIEYCGKESDFIDITCQSSSTGAFTVMYFLGPVAAVCSLISLAILIPALVSALSAACQTLKQKWNRRQPAQPPLLGQQ